eukprot:1281408-Rhodomonas_salina.1
MLLLYAPTTTRVHSRATLSTAANRPSSYCLYHAVQRVRTPRAVLTREGLFVPGRLPEQAQGHALHPWYWPLSAYALATQGPVAGQGTTLDLPTHLLGDPR